MQVSDVDVADVWLVSWLDVVDNIHLLANPVVYLEYCTFSCSMFLPALTVKCICAERCVSPAFFTFSISKSFLIVLPACAG